MVRFSIRWPLGIDRSLCVRIRPRKSRLSASGSFRSMLIRSSGGGNRNRVVDFGKHGHPFGLSEVVVARRNVLSGYSQGDSQ